MSETPNVLSYCWSCGRELDKDLTVYKLYECKNEHIKLVGLFCNHPCVASYYSDH